MNRVFGQVIVPGQKVDMMPWIEVKILHYFHCIHRFDIFYYSNNSVILLQKIATSLLVSVNH